MFKTHGTHVHDKSMLSMSCAVAFFLSMLRIPNESIVSSIIRDCFVKRIYPLNTQKKSSLLRNLQIDPLKIDKNNLQKFQRSCSMSSVRYFSRVYIY